MSVYSVSTRWEKCKNIYHFYVSGDTTLKQLYQYILLKNHEWHHHRFTQHKFSKVWYENLMTNEKADESIRIEKLATTRSDTKKISGELIREIHLQFKASLH